MRDTTDCNRYNKFLVTGNKWLYKNKEHGMLSATASIGLVLLWDVDGGLTQIDKYLYSPGKEINKCYGWKLV